ncbi:MAG TPA: hypothetical protein VMZ28_22965 [Kofleriaceae bacterium]|nr:hypothetical protein [Kofleriaceae bacterium]
MLSGCASPTYEFQPITAGKDETRAPRARSNSQLVRAVYADLVGRAPQVYNFLVYDAQGTEVSRFPLDEQALLIDTLDSVGDPTPMRALLIAGLVDSAEVSLPDKDDAGNPAAYITGQFRAFLGREPGAYELAAFTAAWREDPAVGPKTVVRALLGSREYQSF